MLKLNNIFMTWSHINTSLYDKALSVINNIKNTNFLSNDDITGHEPICFPLATS